ncbi:hypothetical protein PYH37_003798 [Sinorhizobium numidicum]|uniref:Endonuclease/exonuclease/phosphatase domain-containing protein n=1 Tax=Sinorhizobium numidicum TaxID=680248 RepID=A0ABY8CUD7_9HYPH|nr:hypothetical protein [Sinorhizobium numidicum]WEX78866.1 hypothetical protein PYH37_003798 [Sinorhizobium numidicum]WEX82263.1 hypothetical protein PYH38_004511 [Sinorhizobium numidicum]
MTYLAHVDVDVLCLQEVVRSPGVSPDWLVVSRAYTDTRTSHYGKYGRFADYMLVTKDVDIIRFEDRALLLDLP